MEKQNTNFKELLENKIVTPVKGQIGDIKRQLAELAMQNKRLKIWLVGVSVVAVVALVFALLACV